MAARTVAPQGQAASCDFRTAHGRPAGSGERQATIVATRARGRS